MLFDDRILRSTPGAGFSASVTVSLLESGTGYCLSLSAPSPCPVLPLDVIACLLTDP